MKASLEELFLNRYLVENNHVTEDALRLYLREDFEEVDSIEEIFQGLDELLIELISQEIFLLRPDNTPFYLSFFSRRGNSIYTSSSNPRVYVDADRLRQKLVHYIRERKKEDLNYLEDGLVRSIADVLSKPIVVQYVQFFGTSIDDRFLLRNTRELQARINGFQLIDSFKATEIFTYAFSHYYNLLGNCIWGCSSDLILCSLKFEFILRLKNENNYLTLEDARNNIVTTTTPRRGVDQLVDLDKALPFVTDIFEKSEQLYYQNLFLVSSEIFNDYLDTNLVIETRFITPKILRMPLTFSDISNRIPDFDGSSKDGIWSFIKEVDELIFDTEADAATSMINYYR